MKLEPTASEVLGLECDLVWHEHADRQLCEVWYLQLDLVADARSATCMLPMVIGCVPYAFDSRSRRPPRLTLAICRIVASGIWSGASAG